MKALYRIVNSILAALIFPAALFLDLIFFQVSATVVDYGLEESITLKRVIDILMGNDRLSTIVLGEAGHFEWPEIFDPINGKLIAFVVFFALVLVTALFIIIWSCCSSKRIPVVVAGALGVIFSIAMIICFNKAAAPILAGEIKLTALAGEGLLSSILGGLIQVDTLMLGGFHNAFIIIMGLIIVWTGAYYLVELGDKGESEKKKK